VKETKYTDTRIAWGAERCYAVRTVETIGDLVLESDAQPAPCTKLVDTFPPAAPQGLTAVPNQRAISLIWEPNAEKDLGGYILLRGTSPDKLEPITSAPIQETSFTDTVPAGAHYVYAVKAVDKAGNVSGPSKPEEATARE
jgi:fibronectin type 3 domain-containing protein